MRPFLALFLAFFCTNIGFVQGQSLSSPKTRTLRCGSDEIRFLKEQQQPALLQKRQDLDRQILQYTAQENSATPQNLPVVVHIIHQNGAENINDNQVLAALDFLNAAFSNSGAFQTNTGFDTDIQFCLAKQDINGKATSGIQRIVSPLTLMTIETDDVALKNLMRWDTKRYINIWVVASISSLSTGDGVSGYAFLPSSAGGAGDGLVCEADYFGTSPMRTAVLIHEMGHYLGLYHTFEGACQNFNCQTEGDHVCDTPPDRAQHTTCPFNSCHTDTQAASNNPFTSDVDDFTENFMDYSPLSCYRSFTAGQAERMQAVLANTRKSLSDSKGCALHCSSPIVAAFQASVPIGLVGETLVFQNQSTGATSYEWLNGVQIFSTATQPSLSFPSSGLYPITLFATNADPQCIDSFKLNFQVICPVSASFSYEIRQYSVGDTLFFTNESQAATNYEWLLNGQTIGSISDFYFVFQDAGMHIFALVADNGFCSDQFGQSFTVLAACQGSLCPEICDNSIDDDGDGYVDCYDSDCACFSGSTCTVPALDNNFSLKLSWQSQKNEVSVDAVPLVANMNPQQDSLPEIIVLTAPSQISSEPGNKVLIFKGDGSNAGTPSELPIPKGYDAYPMTHPTIGDVDADGIPELILVEFDGLVRVYRNFDPQKTPCMDLWLVSDKPAWNRNARPTLADFNGDGIPEIYTGNVVFRFDFSDPSQARLLRVLEGNGHVGQVLYRDFQENGTVSVAADMLAAADCGGDSDCNGLELVAGSVIYSIDLDSTDGDGYEVKIQKDLNLLAPNQAWKDGYTAVADMDLDGLPDVVVSSGHDDRYGLYVWNKNGLLAFMPYETETFLSGSIPCIANIFNDKTAGFSSDFPEIIACSHKKLSCFNLQAALQNPAKPYWWLLTTTDASGLTGSSVFDFNGDGFSEIVYRDEEHLRILYGGAAPFPTSVDAERNWFRFPTGSGTFDEYPIVADVDADGEAEIAVTGYTTSGAGSPITDYRGRLRVFGSGSAPWVPARQVWNQFNYFVSHIQDDLKVPREQQKHWLEFPFTGSQNRPFNAHLSQQSGLDANFLPFYPVPDAAVVLKNVVCANGSLKVTIEIENQGSQTIPAGAALQWYAADPRLTATTTVGTPWVLPSPLPPDSTQNHEISLSIQGNIHLFGLFNDNASLVTPFDLVTDFPSTDLPECNFENNIFELQYDYSPLVLDLGIDQSLCNSSTTQLTPNSNFPSYRWSTGSIEKVLTMSAPAKIWLDTWDICGRHQSDTVLLLLAPQTGLDLPNSIDLCGQNKQTLTILGFDTVFWQPSSLVDCNTCASVQVQSQKDTILYVTATKNGCIASDTLSIHCHPNPELMIEADTLACYEPNGAAILVQVQNGTTPYIFTWSNGHQGALCQTLVAGTYAVTVSDQHQCTATISHTLADLISLQLAPKTDSISCFGGHGVLALQLVSGLEPIQYVWSNGNTTNRLSDIPKGTYTVWAEDANQCLFADTFLLSEPPPIGLNFQVDTLSCEKRTGTLIALPFGGTPPYQYHWQHGLNTAVIDNQKADNYSIQIIDSKFCSFIDSTTFLYDTIAPVFYLQADSIAIPCNETSVELLVDSSPNDPNLVLPAWRIPRDSQYIWQTGVEQITAFEQGWYAFSLQNIVNFCTNIDSVFVFPAPKIDTLYSKSFDLSCFGSNDGAFHVQSIVGGQAPFLFTLNDTLSQHNPYFSDLMPDFYTLFVSDTNGCAWHNAFLIAEPEPFWVDLYASKLSIERGEAIDLVATVTPDKHPLYSQAWHPKALFTDQSLDQQSVFLEDSTEITFQVVDTSGCTAEDRVFIDVVQVDVYAPNVVAPNSQTNSFFTLYSARDVKSVVDLSIYNRWGSLVFQQKNFLPNRPLLGWDASVGKKQADAGVYVWKAEILLKNGEKRRLQGDITVVR